MTNLNLDKMRDKIKALLAKSNDTSCTEAEAAAFNVKAHELMAKYNIDRIAVEAEAEAVRGKMTLRVQLRPWSQYVLGGITKLYYCTYFSVKLDAKGRQHEITIVGEEQNLAVCHAICIMVLRSITTAARSAGDGRSFMTGAGYEVQRRCMEMYSAAHSFLPAAPGQAQLTHNADAKQLMVVSQQEAKGNALYIQNTLGINLRMRKSTGPKVTSLSSFDRGTAHGSTVQLRRNLLR